VRSAWATPPLCCGLLPGVMREELLAQQLIEERSLSLVELRSAVHRGAAMRCMNSLRGVYRVELTEENPE